MTGIGFIYSVADKGVVPTERREFTPVDIETSVTPLGGSSLVKEAGSLMASACGRSHIQVLHLSS